MWLFGMTRRFGEKMGWGRGSFSSLFSISTILFTQVLFASKLVPIPLCVELIDNDLYYCLICVRDIHSREIYDDITWI